MKKGSFGMLGKHHSPKTIKKIKIARKKQIIKSPSAETRKKISESNSKENSYNWKGGFNARTDKLGIHLWVVLEKGKAENYICECCKRNKAYEWSNIDHKYKKDLRDYRALCRSCHRKWDIKYNGYKNLNK